MRRVKKAWVSSSALPSWWSTQPSKVTLMLKVKSPMGSSVRYATNNRPWTLHISKPASHCAATNHVHVGATRGSNLLGRQCSQQVLQVPPFRSDHVAPIYPCYPCSKRLGPQPDRIRRDIPDQWLRELFESKQRRRAWRYRSQ